MSRTPTMATLVMRFEVAIGEDWSKLLLRGLKLMTNETTFFACSASVLLTKDL